MFKKCKRCGREFEPAQPKFVLCQDCFRSHQNLPENLLLKSYYDKDGNLLKEVFIGVPETLARVLHYDGLKIKQLRDFYQKILGARTKAFLKGINAARSKLYECQRDGVYQLKRDVIPKSFSQFLEYHISLAEKGENMLEGFYQHFESVVAYYPREKGG